MLSRGLIPNRGGGPAARRPPHGLATYVLEGPLRFVDRRGGRAALLVEGGNAAGRRFVGQTVTLDLASARIGVADRDGDGRISASDLLSGERVSASVRLPRGLAEPPELLEVGRLNASYAPVAG